MLMAWLRLEISIHALRKESDLIGSRLERLDLISIHALRKESDPCYLRFTADDKISIHALRKESDRLIRLW